MRQEEFESIMLRDLKFLEFEGRLSRNMYRRIRIDGFTLRQSGLTVGEFQEIVELLSFDKISIRSEWGFENIHADFEDPEVFRRCFDYFQKLAFDYEGDLPESPLVSEEIIEADQKRVYLLNESDKIFVIRFETNRDSIYIKYEDKAENYDGPKAFRRFVE